MCERHGWRLIRMFLPCWALTASVPRTGRGRQKLLRPHRGPPSTSPGMWTEPGAASAQLRVAPPSVMFTHHCRAGCGGNCFRQTEALPPRPTMRCSRRLAREQVDHSRGRKIPRSALWRLSNGWADWWEMKCISLLFPASEISAWSGYPPASRPTQQYRVIRTAERPCTNKSASDLYLDFINVWF